jgi:2'-5' RNA ligase
VPVPADVREQVGEVVERVKADAERASPDDRPVRWVRLDGLHVTVRFLGPTPADRLPGVEQALVDTAAAVAPFGVRLHGGGGFPRPDRPRTLWVRIADGEASLAALARRLDDALAKDAWPRETRPFKAHLTLARSDGLRAGPPTLQALIDEASRLDASWTADELVLFESVTGGGPARYEPLLRAPLTG